MANTRLRPKCSLANCGKPHLARGFCAAHYNRWKRHGAPTGGGTTPGSARHYFENVVLSYEGDDCLIWPFNRHPRNGYGAIHNSGKNEYVHRLVCKRLHGAPPSSKHEAAHACGKGHLGCCNPKHIRWLTRRENVAETALHGRQMRGASHAHAKLTESDVYKIRALAASGMHQGKIGKMFGVGAQAVNDIHRRRNWAWLPER